SHSAACLNTDCYSSMVRKMKKSPELAQQALDARNEHRRGSDLLGSRNGYAARVRSKGNKKHATTLMLDFSGAVARNLAEVLPMTLRSITLGTAPLFLLAKAENSSINWQKISVSLIDPESANSQ
ncbi:MAG: hypothetical protein WBW31_02420, partial [Candidatus Sulfotelmatobacter sp.]